MCRLLLSGSASVYRRRPCRYIDNDQSIFDEISVIEINADDVTGQTVRIEELIALYPALRYNMRGDYSHIEGFRLYPKAIYYKADYLAANNLPADTLNKLANTGIISREGILLQVYDAIGQAGTVFGHECLTASKHIGSVTVLTAEPSQLVTMAKAAYDAGLKNAVAIETEARIGYLMTKVFHDMLPVTISRRIGEELIMHEVCVRKGKSYPKSGEPQVYCVSKGSIAVSRQVKLGRQAQPFVYKKELMSWRMGFQAPPTRLPDVSDKNKRYDVELCMNNKLKKLMLRKKENQTDREVLAQVCQGEIFGMFEAFMDIQYPYDIIALEDSSIMCMSVKVFNEFIDESPYFCKFVAWHVIQARKYGKVVDQSKQRLEQVMAKLKDQLSIAERRSKSSRTTGGRMAGMRGRLHKIIDVRDHRNADIFATHNAAYCHRHDIDGADAVAELGDMFRKERRRIRYDRSGRLQIEVGDGRKVRRITEDSSFVSIKIEESDVCMEASKMFDLVVDPGIDLQSINHKEISFGHGSDRQTDNTDGLSGLKTRLDQICHEPGGRTLAEYVSRLLLKNPVKDRHVEVANKKHYRSYDEKSRNMKKMIFETVIDKTTDRGNESMQVDLSVMPIKLGRSHAKSSDPRKPRVVNYSAKKNSRAKSSMFKYTDEILT